MKLYALTLTPDALCTVGNISEGQYFYTVAIKFVCYDQ